MGNLQSGEFGRPAVVLDSVMESMSLPGAEYFDSFTPPRRDETRGPYIPGRGISGVTEVFSDRDVGYVQGRKDLVGVYYFQDPHDPTVPLNSLGAWQFEGETKRALLEPLVKYLRDPNVMNGPDGVLPYMRQTGQQILDRIIEQAIDQGEGVVDYAELARIPMAAACKMVGVPLEDSDRISAWLETYQGEAKWDKPQLPDEEQYWSELLAHYKRQAILDPDKEPTNIMEVLVRAQRDTSYFVPHPITGMLEPLSDRMLIAQARMMMTAATDTTRNLAGNVIQSATDHNQVEPIVKNPQLLIPVVNEAIRRTPTFPRSLGIARESFVVGEGDGQMQVNPYDVLEAIIPAANFDPRQHPGDPYAFDPTRRQRPNRTFGRGWRACIGEELGRDVVTTVAGLVLYNLVEVRTDPDTPVIRNDGLVNSIRQYRLRFNLAKTKALHESDVW